MKCIWYKWYICTADKEDKVEVILADNYEATEAVAKNDQKKNQFH